MQNAHLFSEQTKLQFDKLLSKLKPALKGMAQRDKDLFLIRLERYFQNLYDGLYPVYGQREDFGAFLGQLVTVMLESYKARPSDLKVLDIERDITPDWFQREQMVGYVFYVERFADSIKGILDKLDYLEELGVTYVHLMKLIHPREGENDGGFAVLDYRDVDPKLGSVDDLEALCSVFRERGISVCIDLVLNHCAKDHAWAKAALDGDKVYQDYFYMFPDRTMPDEYEKTLLEVFPDFAPGSFSYYEDIDKWVWTTFYEFQWDLNWSNPKLFLEIVEIMMYWANKGVDVFRLDAVAFMWKRLGTQSQNQLEVFDLLQALRSCSRIATPAVAHKAEAIVSPDDLVKYFGVGKHHGKVSNLAYHNSLMVQYWSALASRDTRLMTHTLREFPRTPNSIAWGTYIRCHDDIGWAVTDEDAAAIGLNGFLHRKFLSDYYAGEFEGSHAKGQVFQFNPVTQDKRISGSFASLAGLEKGLEENNQDLTNFSVKRMLMGFALICGFGGIPLLYMGDELGLINDKSYLKEDDLAKDNRWAHRPFMDWKKAEKRHKQGTLEAKLFEGLQNIIKVRKQTPQLSTIYESVVLDIGHPHLFIYRRLHPLGAFLAIYNFTDSPQSLDSSICFEQQLTEPFDQLSQTFVDIQNGLITLEPYQSLWLV